MLPPALFRQHALLAVKMTYQGACPLLPAPCLPTGAPKIPSVRWEDVGGLADVKRAILDTGRRGGGGGLTDGRKGCRELEGFASAELPRSGPDMFVTACALAALACACHQAPRNESVLFC